MKAVPLCAAVALLACDASSGIGAGSTIDPPFGGGGGGGGGGGSCEQPDTCSFDGNGVTWDCKTRFMHGTNYAWRSFAGDFGGGIDANPGPYSEQLRQMKAAGVSVIRWWMFPRFITNTIQWDAEGGVSGITQGLTADIQRALALAEEHDVYIMLTPFSFDNFKPSSVDGTRSLKPAVVDASLRKKMMDNLLGPIADAVRESPHRKRMIAWDIINEPEWAMHGPSLTGDADFPAQGNLELVTHAEMETFLKDATNVLRARSGAPVSVGGAAIKWARAWTRLGLDFYQLHYYDWVYENFPYQTESLVKAGLTDKPVVMGEFPSDGVSAVPSKGLPARSAAQFTQDLLDHGYAGALSWAFNDGSFPFNPGDTRSFADANGCGVTY
jgi:hypothetical protein